MTRRFIRHPRLLPLAASALLALGLSAAHAQQPTPPSGGGMESADAAFKRADKNADGKLTKAEARAIPGLPDRFDAADTDKDGMISMTEFMAVLEPKKQ
jgi:hypothetical protein